MLAGISEENLLVQLEIEYQGDITSCNKVENYLQYSEYEYEDYSNSSDSSHVHSEQVTISYDNVTHFCKVPSLWHCQSYW